jgi:hypothetical protein
MEKKGDSQYISWILIFGLVVLLSFLLYNWSIKQAQTASEQIEKSADPLACSEIGFSVEGACQTTRSLEMNLTNTNTVVIEGIQVKSVGLYPEETIYLDSKVKFLQIDPGETEKVSLLKKSTLSHAEIIPIVKKNKKYIYCSDKTVNIEQQALKQC